MKVSGEWLSNPDTQKVCEVLFDAGFDCYFVGGCVRNALLGVSVNDIDIATNAQPEQVVAIAQKAGLKPIPTGIDHGTITVISGGRVHEITTFRRDVATDGRHAKVTYSQSILEDAKRRDFTMNALYCDSTGRVVDPLGGIDDLTTKSVRFILDPDCRIKEDYLRILRFFRFFAWYGDPAQGIDAEGLAACAQNADGLDGISRERISAEMLKLLAADNPAVSMAAMEQSGVLNRLVAGATSKTLPILVHLEEDTNTKPKAIRRLAALGDFDWATALRLSNADKAALKALHFEISDGKPPATLGYLYGEAVAKDIVLLRSAMLEMPLDLAAVEKIQFGSNQTFPVSAKDLMPKYTGARLGEKLKYLQGKWFESGLRATKDALLDGLDR